MNKGIIKVGVGILSKAGSQAFVNIIIHYNKMFLNGEISKLRKEIKIEVFKNKLLAKEIFEKYKKDMCDEVREMYSEELE